MADARRDEQRENGRLAEPVKIPLPFEDAVKGLLATQPDDAGNAEKPRENTDRPAR
jgi:hypothetical protein